MFKKEYLKKASVPIAVTTVAYFFMSFLTLPQNTFGRLGVALVSTIIFEFFAYCTCYAFVFRKGKSDGHIWINYMIWLVMMIIGNIGEIV